MTNDTQLKQALAKMLPDGLLRWSIPHKCYVWIEQNAVVENTELLHLCWMVKISLTTEQRWPDYYDAIAQEVDYDQPAIMSATWQQRVIALCKVKGMELCHSHS